MISKEPTERENRKHTVADRLQGKTSKEEVNYRPAADEAESKISCSECAHYLQAGHEHSNCRRVAGIVEARDICDLFVERSEEHDQQPGLNVQLHVNIGDSE